jgi:hypothetical protein
MGSAPVCGRSGLIFEEIRCSEYRARADSLFSNFLILFNPQFSSLSPHFKQFSHLFFFYHLRMRQLCIHSFGKFVSSFILHSTAKGARLCAFKGVCAVRELLYNFYLFFWHFRFLYWGVPFDVKRRVAYTFCETQSIVLIATKSPFLGVIGWNLRS